MCVLMLKSLLALKAVPIWLPFSLAYAPPTGSRDRPHPSLISAARALSLYFVFTKQIIFPSLPLAFEKLDFNPPTASLLSVALLSVLLTEYGSLS